MTEDFNIFKYLKPGAIKEVIPENKKNFSRYDDIPTSLSEMAYIMSMFSNDMKHLHLHAIGDDFDKIHEITEELYELASEDTDTLCELAIRQGETIENLNDCQSVIPAEVYSPIHIEELSEVMIENMKQYIFEKGNALVRELRNINKNYTSDIISKIDEITDRWAKEIDYKNDQRLKRIDDNLSTNFSNKSNSERLREILNKKK